MQCVINMVSIVWAHYKRSKKTNDKIVGVLCKISPSAVGLKFQLIDVQYLRLVLQLHLNTGLTMYNLKCWIPN
jgi:hypothetical protein